jgi:hypothetical protein
MVRLSNKKLQVTLSVPESIQVNKEIKQDVPAKPTS